MRARTRAVVVVLSCCVIASCVFPTEEPKTAAAGNQASGPAAEKPHDATPAADSPDDASEIAARAVASAVAAAFGERNNDLAADAYDAVVRDLLLRIEAIETEHGRVERELEAPLFELGKLYALANQCQNAIPMLRQAILLSQRLDGVMLRSSCVGPWHPSSEMLRPAAVRRSRRAGAE